MYITGKDGLNHNHVIYECLCHQVIITCKCPDDGTKDIITFDDCLHPTAMRDELLSLLQHVIIDEDKLQLRRNDILWMKRFLRKLNADNPHYPRIMELLFAITKKESHEVYLANRKRYRDKRVAEGKSINGRKMYGNDQTRSN